ncbi:farnesyl pyrophosphate synthase [Thermoplasma volcanium GSS1]|uniref:Farnesyl pyrophosphate synthase n=1 Tax=Thermoplasma volcanium (strain ATCC 51530 / DSM 4299 / JCM 9571 / NBRC 15438 / GSS1) TaxID=273116 RepID=Q979S6_THEVO|nr:polyprenyl synthetase family protein [Thermoplasma volcanium]BAB60226.1 farnesyl pyrophosphate synthase [Thermoplasma volcanium GSS1]
MKSFYEWELALHSKIEEVNERLFEVVKSEEPDLDRMAKYTIEAGGKRFRPLLTILAFESSTDDPYFKILDLAAGYELIHTASLIHDDIIDDSPMRRGRPTLSYKEGINNAIVVADYLFAKAYELGSRYGPLVSKVMADASSRLAEGQILEAVNLGNLDITEDTYYKIIENKTAHFFEACALGATIVAEADRPTREILSNFAFNLGMAFQVTDDILDIVGDDRYTGKPTFVDIKHDALTLPIIYALRNSNDNDRRAIIDMINGRREINKSLLKDIFLKSGSIDYSFSVAKQYITKSMDYLKKAKKSPDIDLLMELAFIVIDRIEIFQ